MKSKINLFFGKLFNTRAYRKHILKSNVPHDFTEWAEDFIKINITYDVFFLQKSLKNRHRHFEQIPLYTFMIWLNHWCDFHNYDILEKHSSTRTHNGRVYYELEALTVISDTYYISNN